MEVKSWLIQIPVNDRISYEVFMAWANKYSNDDGCMFMGFNYVFYSDLPPQGFNAEKSLLFAFTTDSTYPVDQLALINLELYCKIKRLDEMICHRFWNDQKYFENWILRNARMIESPAEIGRAFI